VEDEAQAMARAVKRGRDALVEAVRRGLHGAGTAVPRASHAQVFECLDPDGTRLTVLADRARMSHQAMGEMVDELTRHGFLERVPDPADGRARLIRPTARGRHRWSGRGRAPDAHCDLRVGHREGERCGQERPHWTVTTSGYA
jgi:hypothetical protein